MTFVERAKDGSIKGVYAQRQPGHADEELPDDHADVVAFNARMESILFAPPPISDFQFAAALMSRGVITPDEATAFVKVGDIPVAMQKALDAIPDEKARTLAMLRVSGATTYRRDHPLTQALAAELGWTSDQVDALWKEAAAI